MRAYSISDFLGLLIIRLWINFIKNKIKFHTLWAKLNLEIIKLISYLYFACLPCMIYEYKEDFDYGHTENTEEMDRRKS